MSEEKMDRIMNEIQKSRGENYHSRMLRLQEEYGAFR